MPCNCDCHKQDSFNKLKKCEDKNKRKEKRIQKLEKKVLTLTLIAAIIGTLVGKEVVEEIVGWFDSVNQVKTIIDDVTINDNIPLITYPLYYGTSPSPGSLAIFGMYVLIPPRRRK
jgi:hypothetical protein